MAKKQGKKNPKIHWIAYILAGIVLILVITTITLSIPNKKVKLAMKYDKNYKNLKTEDKKSSAYIQSLTLKKDNLLVEKSVNDIIKLIKSNDLILLYVGHPTNNVCVQEVGTYDSELKEYLKSDISKLDKKTVLYYVEHFHDISGVKETDAKNFDKLVELGVKQETPGLYAFYKGKLLDVKYTPTAPNQPPKQDAVATSELKRNVRDFYFEVDLIVNPR